MSEASRLFRFPALAKRNFRIFWAGQAVSMIGFWMQSIGMAWLVLKLSDSPFMLGLVTALQTLPMLLFSLFAGTLVDRFNRRQVLFVTQGCMGMLALVMGLLVWSNQIQLWHIMTLSVLLGLINTLDVPTRQSFVIELAGRDSLMNAISLNSTVFNLARLLGPALAGLLIGIVGIAPCFFINALSFAGVLLSLKLLDSTTLHTVARSAIHPASPHPRILAGIRADTVAGLRYVAGKPGILMPMVLLAIISTFVINYTITVPLFAKQELGQDAAGFGFLMAAMGGGSFLSALVLAAGGRSKPDPRWLYGGAVLMSAFLVVLALQNSYGLSCLAMFISGFCAIAFTASCNSQIQLQSEDPYRGRVMSIFALVFGGVTPIGSLYTGFVADQWGVRAALVSSGLIGLAAAMAVVIMVLRQTRPMQKQ